MEGSMIDLSRYRYEKALDDLDTARVLQESGKYAASANRSYYAVFHALRAVTALDGFDSKKHSGIISYINREYVKKGIFDKQMSKLVGTASRLREKADYEDYIEISAEQAERQVDNAEAVLGLVEPYLEERWRASVELDFFQDKVSDVLLPEENE